MSQVTRRKFLKNGAKGVALVSIPVFFKFNPMVALASEPSVTTMGSTDYFNHFGVTEALLREVMETALSRGGDYCDLFFQHSISSYIGLEDDLVNRAYTGVDFGVGIRVLKGDQTGFSFTEEVTPKTMKLAAKTAANIASGTAKPLPDEFKIKNPANYYPIETTWESIKIDQKIPYIKKLNENSLALESKIIKSRAYFSDITSYIMLVNSECLIRFDYQPMTRFGISLTAEKNGERQSGGFNLSGRYGIDRFSDKKINYMARQAVDRTMTLFDAVKPEAGEMPVVLAAGSSGILLHEAIGHGMEADFNRKGISIFADKIDKPVAENFVTIVDDGTNENMRGSINIDDEGGTPEKTYLVKDGIMRSYIHDRISAKHYGVKPTGSGRRQSFRYAPLPRMRNTYMENGPHTKEEIIKSVKKGLYAEVFSNGQVFIGAGDFSFYVTGGTLIEDGKLTKPVKDINIIGNGPDVLKKITMVAGDFKMAEGGWTCGKSGQSVPVSMGLPTVKVSSITVGGMNS